MEEVTLTEEERKALRGSLAIRPDETFQYVPQAYRCYTIKDGVYVYTVRKELWPVFTLKGVDGVQATLDEDNLHGEVHMDGGGKSSITVRRGQHSLRTCARGIITWRNLRDASGRLVSPPEPDTLTKGIKEDALRILPPALIAELTNAITERSTLTEEELRGLE